MSADEESFIVLDETPSLLQYSLLNSPVIISENDDLSYSHSMTNAHDSLRSNSSISSENKYGIDITDNSKKSKEDFELNANLVNMSLNNSAIKKSPINSLENNTITNQQQAVSSELNNSTKPKSSLAQNFLLGDIDCKTMKVR